jgi:hypothetical protein
VAVNDIKLNIGVKATLSMIGLFAISTILISLSFTLTAGSGWIQLDSLLHSDYEYSAVVEKPIGIDDYYFYEAGIAFTVSREAQFRINAEILMQPERAEYSSSVAWSAEKLRAGAVAITDNIAETYGLIVGDNLYSKHRVTDVIEEYTIEQVVSAAANSGIDGNTASAGIIIIGFDNNYAGNIAHKTIVFFDESVAELARQHGIYPLDITYRDDEIVSTIRNLLPPVLLAIILAVSVSILLSWRLCNCMKIIFKRLLILGYSHQSLVSAWNKEHMLIYAIPMLFSLLVTSIGTHILIGDSITLIQPCLIFIFQAIVGIELCRSRRKSIERS